MIYLLGIAMPMIYMYLCQLRQMPLLSHNPFQSHLQALICSTSVGFSIGFYERGGTEILHLTKLQNIKFQLDIKIQINTVANTGV